jgi:hypothetical protein
MAQIGTSGLFANSAIAFALPPASEEAVARLSDLLITTPVIVGMEPKPAVKGDEVVMGFSVRASNRSMQPQSVELAVLAGSAGTSSTVERKQAVALPARSQLQQETAAWAAGPVPAQALSGDTRSKSAGRNGANAVDWRFLRVKVALGALPDEVDDTADAKALLQRICDFAVVEQKKRGDGKYSGITYRDSRVARSLLVAGDLFGKKEYLDSAVAWGDSVIAEQREDGGYRMGYGISPKGEECFVADGGEIGLGIACLISYLPAPKKEVYLRSLQKYNAFRESFRCEGGGLGIGYAGANYGVDEKKRFDKVEKVFDPEHNVYTIGCTLGFAAAYAALTGDPKAHASAARDARWLMARQPNRTHGVFAEGFIWSHRFVRDDALRKEIEAYLEKALVKPSIASGQRWWLGGGGRMVLALSALKYYFDSIRPEPDLLAHIIKVTYHLCAQGSDEYLGRLLEIPRLPSADWHFLGYGGVSLSEIISPGSTMKPLQ